MQASERQVFGSTGAPTPLWMWAAQRLSGILLGPLVLVHAAGAGGGASAVLDTLLLALIVIHGHAGIRRMRMKVRHAGSLSAAAALWVAVVLAFGVLSLIHAH